MKPFPTFLAVVIHEDGRVDHICSPKLFDSLEEATDWANQERWDHRAGSGVRVRVLDIGPSTRAYETSPDDVKKAPVKAGASQPF